MVWKIFDFYYYFFFEYFFKIVIILKGSDEYFYKIICFKIFIGLYILKNIYIYLIF